MTDKRQTARQKLQKAQKKLAQPPNADALTVALLAINGALDDWFGIEAPRPRSRSGRYDIDNYRAMPEYRAMREQGSNPRLKDELHQLRRDGIITSDECKHILDMREERNAGAHGGQPDVTYAEVKWYCELVERIIGERARRENMAKSGAQSNAQQPSNKTRERKTKAERVVSSSSIPRPPAKQEHTAPPAIIKSDPHATPQPPAPQLQAEVGGNEPVRLTAEDTPPPPESSSKTDFDPNELLRQLLSTPINAKGLSESS